MGWILGRLFESVNSQTDKYSHRRKKTRLSGLAAYRSSPYKIHSPPCQVSTSLSAGRLCLFLRFSFAVAVVEQSGNADFLDPLFVMLSGHSIAIKHSLFVAGKRGSGNSALLNGV